jgi:radical S-adenosyl methionine domain-containing protein 2
VAGENDNAQRKRDARAFLVSDEQWKVFCERHEVLECFVPESNDMMRSSYLILDEYMRFLSRGVGTEAMSQSILDVGVKKAMNQVTWDQGGFVERGGVYDWSKSKVEGCGGVGDGAKELEW